jgi:hypothetical protein
VHKKLKSFASVDLVRVVQIVWLPLDDLHAHWHVYMKGMDQELALGEQQMPIKKTTSQRDN